MTKKSRRVAKARRALFTLGLVLIVAFAAVGGTIAWLTSTTNPVVNTFTTSDVEITLNETGTTKNTETNAEEKSWKMVPGATLDKDPKVTVSTDSEDCYVYVVVTESTNLDQFIDYSVITGEGGWTALGDSYPGVYYREVLASDTTRTFSVIQDAAGTDNKVTVKSSVTKDMMDNLTEATYPTLTFKAYAIQKSNLTAADGVTAVTTAAGAWELITK